jgi:putative lipoic acid-binding regulatory protein
LQTFGGRRPEISYPCFWTYRVICTDEPALRSAVASIVGAAEHTLERIGDSASGRYHRLELVVSVRDEAHRNEIFVALGRVVRSRTTSTHFSSAARRTDYGSG